jgi:two-component system LytT family response regulator
MRFEERLKYSISFSSEAGRVEIPPMMIQTLVENGIKHGISKKTEGGEILIDSKVENSDLLIEIRNIGYLEDSALKNSKGFGVANTKHRLNLLFGERASFSLTNENENKVALIVDDERLARTELKRLLTSFKEINVVGEAVNADDALEKIQELKPDLLFLDIQMPGKTGFDMLEELDAVPTVIFVTAYDEYALKAFEYNALDYLLKPIEPKRLEETVNKLIEKKRKKTISELDKDLLMESDQVFVKDGEKCWFVKLENVRLFESEGNYVRIYFSDNKPLILRTLNYLDERLDNKTFFRANRKHIVNLKWIASIEPWLNGGLLVKLKDGQKVEVSRRQAIKFKDMLSL